MTFDAERMRENGVVPAPTRVPASSGNARSAARESLTPEAGEALDATTRGDMERSFGADFGDVRVHSGGASAATAGALNANAFSVGSDIVFGEGRYAPQTPGGKRLIAHELAHVVQQRGTGRPIAPDHAAVESDANRAAASAVAGEPAPVQQRAPVGAPLREAATATPSAKPEAPRKPQREERLNVGRHGKVDAELDRSVGWLTVRMKVKFEQTSTPQAWPSVAKFEDFKTKFVQTVSARWSFKHYLVPTGDCAGEPKMVSVRVQLIPVTAGEHATVKVGYASANVRSYAGPGTATLDSLDAQRRNDIPQVPGEHEFGHMLGLGHIHCDRNDDDCYGTNATERADIMGSGSFVSPRDYEPFAELMKDFTGCKWEVRPASQIPTSRGPDIGAAIGFLGGAAAGAAIGGALFGPIGMLAGLALGALGGFLLGREIGTPRIPS